MKIRDLDNWTTEEMYKQAKAGRDLLVKRKKRLDELMDQKPGVYSPFGYKELEKGIPQVSTKMHRNTLKANLMRIEELKDMKTTTARGAKKHQEEQIRLMLNLPVTGRLKKKEKEVYDSGAEFIRQNPSAMSDFWTAFNYYQREVAYKGLDSDRLLDEFRPVFESSASSGYSQIEEIFANMKNIIDEEYRKTERDRGLIQRVGRRGGFL